MKRIFILAAENSAETYGVELVRALKHRIPGVRLFGVGGDRFHGQGVELVYHNRDFSVVGVFEILLKLMRFHRIMGNLVREAVNRKADAAILIDYPDFNLRLARRLKKAGIPVYYYIAPTVWAWRYRRVHQLRHNTDHLFIIFPFEREIYSREKVNHTYTGHPLIPMVKVKQTRREFRNQHGVSDDEILISLLPGSRSSEIDRLLPAMLNALETLSPGRKLKAFLLQAENIAREQLEGYLKGSTVRVCIIPQAYRFDLINATDLALTTCGTSNLEIALLGVPFIAGYRVSPMTYRLRFLLRIRRYSIVNILAGKEVVPELIQDAFTSGILADHAARLLDDPEALKKMRLQLADVTRPLSRDGDPPDIIARHVASDLRCNN